MKPEAWKGLLASFYGGINEEILLRLCVMSFFVWLGRFVSKNRRWLAHAWLCCGSPTSWPPCSLVSVTCRPPRAWSPLTPLVVTRALVLNGLIGIGFGYLYFKHGLEAAMISHFAPDIILHVLFAI